MFADSFSVVSMQYYGRQLSVQISKYECEQYLLLYIVSDAN